MHLRTVFRVVGVCLLLIGSVQLLPSLVALYSNESTWGVLLFSALVSVAVGWGLMNWGSKTDELSLQDGFLAVTLSWCAAGLAGAIPYWASGVLPSFTDAVFESVSGFTTTGATVLLDYGRMGKGMLLWRSLTQWLGGMGMIALGLIVLPSLRGAASLRLYQREASVSARGGLSPRLHDTARILWSVYLLFTIIETAILMLLGMSTFDAINHALTNVSTGGFSTHPDGIAAWNSLAIEWVVIVFMFLGAVNFGLHYRLLTSRRYRWRQLRDEELIWFASVCLIGVLVFVAYLYAQNVYPSWQQIITKASFQAISIISSAGYSSADYVAWGAFSQLLLLAMMLPGGCIGSTAGGMKCIRMALVIKNIRNQITRLAHPRAVVDTRFNGLHIDVKIQYAIYSFVLLLFMSIVILTLLLTLSGLDLFTSLGAAISALNNIGPTVGTLGPSQTYEPLSDFAKWILMLGMLAGRLELMTVFMLFTPYFWRR